MDTGFVGHAEKVIKTQFVWLFVFGLLAVNDYYNVTPGGCVPYVDAGAAHIFFHSQTIKIIIFLIKAWRRCVRTGRRSLPVWHYHE